MSVIQTLKSALPIDDEEVTVRTYECSDCGHVFESTKTPDRAMCDECLSHDTTEQ